MLCRLQRMLAYKRSRPRLGVCNMGPFGTVIPGGGYAAAGPEGGAATLESGGRCGSVDLPFLGTVGVRAVTSPPWTGAPRVRRGESFIES